jgi:hypothetical protein
MIKLEDAHRQEIIDTFKSVLDAGVSGVIFVAKMENGLAVFHTGDIDGLLQGLSRTIEENTTPKDMDHG